ncbi:DNA cytosine methyltransferase [Pseudomonas carnis]|uniref:DNA cytosine methyltransferase n=1 Tax=Pseudomonas carnis TaxID=2487355 RepID=UPI001C6F7264|nr:DNA cytosine methyltransferase [Pseudomonas carnis]MBW9240946.1 DNA cytosine methyltransferase [Pseudomonas carnis]
MSAYNKTFPTIDYKTQYQLGLNESDYWLIVDLFCGGGGGSTGLEMGLGRRVDICVNHDEAAISLHTANHPYATHYQTDVWGVDPVMACGGRTVGWLHASPDCTHFSQAAGGQPRSKEIRDLPWVVVKWAGKVRPLVISAENVKQILGWTNLVAKRCAETGRVVKLDGSIAAPGEVVPRKEQYLIPDSGKPTGNALHRRKQRRKYRRHGSPVNRTWNHFVRSLKALGYNVDWRVSRACDDGAPTIRERLFLIARCDGHPIEWPEASHAKHPKKGQLPYRTAAECIDWSNLGQSIWGRKRPLVKSTNVRIATGIERFVVNGRPFILPATHQGSVRLHDIDEPMRTVTGANRGELMVGTPIIAPFITEHANASQQRNMSAEEPLRTICAQVKGGHFSVVAPILVQANGGKNTTPAHPVVAPFSTITGSGSQQQLVTAKLDSHDLQNQQFNNDQINAALRVADFMLEHGTRRHKSTVLTVEERLDLVTVFVDGVRYLIVDVCLRMLDARELYRAQGFPENYIIDRGHDGRKLNKTQMCKMVGNSVSPLQLSRIARCNDPWKAMHLRMLAA